VTATRPDLPSPVHPHRVLVFWALVVASQTAVVARTARFVAFR